MKENDIKVSDEMLAEHWFQSGLDSLESIKKTIVFFNQLHNFNLYDDNEDLPIEKINLKVNLKYTNICTPLAYVAELFLKSIIISNAKLNNSDNFKRINAVQQLMNNVKSQFKTNAHNLTSLVEYINRNIDENFKIDLARIYRKHRKHMLENTSRDMDIIPRIEFATTLYENAFINARYLYESQDILKEHIDLVKLIDYVNTLRDCCYLQLIKIKLSQIRNVKSVISEYYDLYKDIEDFNSQDIFNCIQDIFSFVSKKFNQTYNENLSANNSLIKESLNQLYEIRRDCIRFIINLTNTDKELDKTISGESLDAIKKEYVQYLPYRIKSKRKQ